MENTVTFREFEERDIDFIYKCKNDKTLNSKIVGHYRPFTYEEAEKWVHGCMGEHDNYKFWAIGTNDEEMKIVGWLSLSDIDYTNKSAYFHGIVIGDKLYQDGFAWIESYLFIMDYVFNVLKLNRLYGSSIIGNSASNSAADVFLWNNEGVLRQSVLKDDGFHDVKLSAILQKEYRENVHNGAYSFSAILKRIKHYQKILKL